MGDFEKVYRLVLSGSEDPAEEAIARLFPACEPVRIPADSFRAKGWVARVRLLWHLKGAALVLGTDRQHNGILLLAALLHRCRTTVFVARTAATAIVTTRRMLFWAGARDTCMLALAHLVAIVVRCWLREPGRVPDRASCAVDLAYLYPVPRQTAVPGGEMSYLTGTLDGLVEQGATVDLISSVGGMRLAHGIGLHVIPERFSILKEARNVAYNLTFFRRAKKILGDRRPRFLYVRHHAFIVAGAVLSRRLRIPLVLEYQNSELWRVKNWDPCHFLWLLKLAENISLHSAHRIVALSAVLRDELRARGIPEERIVVNPAAVDPSRFHPGCGGAEVRAGLGFHAEDIVVTFVGSFSYWHGIPVLQAAIEELLTRRPAETVERLRFLLIGDGILHSAMKERLRPMDPNGRITFTGAVPHSRIPGLLDASDILVSPHIPLEDGSAFFGSPSKLFEYMAMGKAIVASEMFQLAEVLEHGKTAWLITPGDHGGLAEAIEALSRNGRLRAALGRNAHTRAVACHTWAQNASRLLDSLRIHLSKPAIVSTPVGCGEPE